MKDNEILKIVKDNHEKTPAWVALARKRRVKFLALIEGVGFAEYLINDIEKLKKKSRREVRVKFAKDMRDVVSRAFAKRSNVFTAYGSHLSIDIQNEKTLKKINTALSNFKNGFSLNHYMHKNFFKMLDSDPNGLLFLEFTTAGKDFEFNPTYKSISDIRNYDEDKDKLKWILFEPTKEVDGRSEIKTETKGQSIGDREYTRKDNEINIWRFVDEERDVLIRQVKSVFSIIAKDSYAHDFGKVPAIVLSPSPIIGSRLRESSIEKVSELLKELARDKTGLVIYKYRSLNFKEWRIGKKCPTCHNSGEVGGEPCSTCGSGILREDVSEVNLIDPPKNGQAFPSQLSGFIKPDIETVEVVRKEIELLEQKIHDTIWGVEENKKVNERQQTATAKYIDTQPVVTKSHDFTQTVQNHHNFIANLVCKKITGDDNIYSYFYGTRYIIESQESLAKRYQESKKNGDNLAILDANLEELLLANNKGNQKLQELALKKVFAEPYVHMNIIDVAKLFGPEEAYNKILFADFWQTVNKSKKKQDIKDEFIKYSSKNKLIIKTEKQDGKTNNGKKS